MENNTECAAVRNNSSCHRSRHSTQTNLSTCPDSVPRHGQSGSPGSNAARGSQRDDLALYSAGLGVSRPWPAAVAEAEIGGRRSATKDVITADVAQDLTGLIARKRLEHIAPSGDIFDCSHYVGSRIYSRSGTRHFCVD